MVYRSFLPGNYRSFHPNPYFTGLVQAGFQHFPSTNQSIEYHPTIFHRSSNSAPSSAAGPRPSTAWDMSEPQKGMQHGRRSLLGKTIESSPASPVQVDIPESARMILLQEKKSGTRRGKK
jgi:hypothetical protein